MASYFLFDAEDDEGDVVVDKTGAITSGAVRVDVLGTIDSLRGDDFSASSVDFFTLNMTLSFKFCPNTKPPPSDFPVTSLDEDPFTLTVAVSDAPSTTELVGSPFSE